MQILRLPHKVLICVDQWGAERTMFITANWKVGTAKINAIRMNLRPLYVVNLIPKGVEYEKCDG